MFSHHHLHDNLWSSLDVNTLFSSPTPSSSSSSTSTTLHHTPSANYPHPTSFIQQTPSFERFLPTIYDQNAVLAAKGQDPVLETLTRLVKLNADKVVSSKVVAEMEAFKVQQATAAINDAMIGMKEKYFNHKYAKRLEEIDLENKRRAEVLELQAGGGTGSDEDNLLKELDEFDKDNTHQKQEDIGMEADAAEKEKFEHEVHYMDDEVDINGDIGIPDIPGTLTKKPGSTYEYEFKDNDSKRYMIRIKNIKKPDPTDTANAKNNLNSSISQGFVITKVTALGNNSSNSSLGAPTVGMKVLLEDGSEITDPTVLEQGSTHRFKLRDEAGVVKSQHEKEENSYYNDNAGRTKPKASSSDPDEEAAANEELVFKEKQKVNIKNNALKEVDDKIQKIQKDLKTSENTLKELEKETSSSIDPSEKIHVKETIANLKKQLEEAEIEKTTITGTVGSGSTEATAGQGAGLPAMNAHELWE